MLLLTIIEILSAGSLIGLILLQMQGSGLGNSFGGAGEFYRSKRSIEKILIWATVVVTVIFAINSILLLIPTK